MHTSWSGPSFEITRFGRAVPCAGFRFEKAGAVVGHVLPASAGVTDRNVVGAVPPTAVRLKTAAAAAAVAGMDCAPPPDSTTSRHFPGSRGLFVVPAHSVCCPARESQIRSGGMLWN